MTQPPPVDIPEHASVQDAVRSRILAAAIDLLARQGRDALTTRAVAEAAQVQAPTLYRLFGDKTGLLDAVAEYGFATYLKEKQGRTPAADPLENLRSGWDMHVEFGLMHPALFLMMSGNPRSGVQSPAAAAGAEQLGRQISALALAGRLRVSEQRAANLMHAAGTGTVLALLEMPDGRRDLGLCATAREAVISAIVNDVPAIRRSGATGAALALRAALPESTVLSAGEQALLSEWLDRFADSQGI